MKKFLIKIFLLFSLVVLFDFAYGMAMKHIVKNIHTGGQGRDNYICNKADEDILIFGSSRAVHHYNAQMLEDSLGMSSYNCGEDGNGIILNYGRLSMIKERHAPKIIIEDVSTTFDIFKNDNHQYLGWLKPHYDKEDIDKIFLAVDESEKYKMASQMYRYNSKFIQYLLVYLTGISSSSGIKGFRPINAPFNAMKVHKNPKKLLENYEVDSLKYEFFNKFIDLSEGSRLYFVVSPMWYGTDSLKYSSIKAICKDRNIPFYDFSNDPKYVHNNDLFRDGTHMNAKGADEFTRDLIKLLKAHKPDDGKN